MKNLAGTCLLGWGIAIMPISAVADIADIFRTMDHGTSAEKTLVRSLVKATETGFAEANSDLRNNRKEPPLYCPPEKINLTGDQLIDIVRRWVETKRAQATRIESGPMPMALLYALQDAFPCRR
jgi:hypothetical protein